MMRYLELFRSSYFDDISLDQWTPLTPPELVSARLKLDRLMDALRKPKAPVVSA
jgi:oxalate decarboxylase